MWKDISFYGDFQTVQKNLLWMNREGREQTQKHIKMENRKRLLIFPSNAHICFSIIVLIFSPDFANY